MRILVHTLYQTYRYFLMFEMSLLEWSWECTDESLMRVTTVTSCLANQNHYYD